jgi:hypothetical protein
VIAGLRCGLEQVFGYCEVREAVLEKSIMGVVDIDLEHKG